MWNGLDGRIINCKTVATFKTHIFKWLDTVDRERYIYPSLCSLITSEVILRMVMVQWVKLRVTK